MKKITLILIIFLPLIFLAGCETEEDIPKAEVLASVDNAMPFVGDSIFVSWEVSGNYKSLEVRLGDEKISEKDKETMMFIIDSENVLTFSFICLQLNSEQTLKKITITPKKKPPSSLTVGLILNKATIERGDTVQVNWTIFGTIDSIVSNLPVEEFTLPYGEIALSPQENTTFTLTVYGQGIVKEKSVSVVVNDPLPPVISLVANPTSIRRGYTTSTITWNISNKFDSIVSNFGVNTPSGSLVVSPLENTIYELQAYGPGGQTISQIEVNVTDPFPLDFLQNGKWYENEAYITVPHKNIVRQQLVIGECLADNYFLFGQNFQVELNEGPIACEGSQPNLSWVWQYTFIGDTIQIAQGYPRYVEMLNDTILVWHVRSSWHENGISYPTSIEQVFKHTQLYP